MQQRFGGTFYSHIHLTATWLISQKLVIFIVIAVGT